MGIHGKPSGSTTPRRAWYPSGPWIDGIRPAESVATHEPEKKKEKKRPKLPNPDPANYKIVKAKEIGNFLIVMINYPDCINYEGQKILLFQGVTLIDLVNQKYIDPHFFKDKKYASPIARFVPDEKGWDMAETLAKVLTAG